MPYSHWLIKPAQIDTPRIQPNILIGNSPCINLTESGCKIKDFYHRPRGGKLLEPKLVEIENCKPCYISASEPEQPSISFKVEECKSYYTIKEALIEWQPFSVIIEATVEHILAEERLKIKEFHFEHEVCKLCEGRCCKVSGCSFAPSDFKEISYSYLKKIINKGFISIIIVPDIQTWFCPSRGSWWRQTLSLRDGASPALRISKPVAGCVAGGIRRVAGCWQR